MCFDDGEMDLSSIPLMSPAQEATLAQLLPGIMGMMSGFPLGGAYGGPSESSYSVSAFPEFDLEAIKDAKKILEDEKKISKDELTDPNKKITEDQLISPRAKTVGNGPVLDLILNPEQYALPTGMPSMGSGGMPMQSPVAKIPSMGGGKGGTPESQPISPIQQSLTQPIISPFTQGMTGNYPRRPGVGARGGRR